MRFRNDYTYIRAGTLTADVILAGDLTLTGDLTMSGGAIIRSDSTSDRIEIAAGAGQIDFYSGESGETAPGRVGNFAPATHAFLLLRGPTVTGRTSGIYISHIVRLVQAGTLTETAIGPYADNDTGLTFATNRVSVAGGGTELIRADGATATVIVGPTVATNLRIGTAGGFLGLGSRQDAEITAGGAVTVTAGYMRIDVNGGAAATDDLDTINGGTEGDIVVLTATNNSRTVVVKDGTGNLSLAGDMSLDHTQDTITLIQRPDGTWLELARSDNAT